MIMLVLLILPVIGFGVAQGQTVGDLIQTNTLTTTLVNDDEDTLVFRFSSRLDSNRDITLAVKFDYTSGTQDSSNLKYLESSSESTAADENSASTRPVSVESDIAFSDDSWHFYTVSPVMTSFLKILVGHTELGSTSDNATVQVYLIYR